MLNLIKYDKAITVNGVLYASAADALNELADLVGDIKITIDPELSDVKVEPQVQAEPKKEKAPKVAIYRVEVRQYMVRKATPEFDFMDKFNEGIPMPLRRMYGEVLEETPGMYRMKLHGRAERNVVTCSHCMRELTNPVSRAYGIGPKCGGHYWESAEWIDAIIDDEDKLHEEANARLNAVVWEGWIPKKAITSKTRV